MEINCSNNEEAGPSLIVRKEEMERDEAEDLNLEGNDEMFYQCGACKESFAKYLELKEHMKKVRRNKKSTIHPLIPTSFNCVKCNKSFSRMAHLNQHILVHIGEKTHECPECSKRFFQRADLNRHAKIHLDVKPVQCEICLKRFTQNVNCITHMRTHTGQKPFECPICQLCFSQKAHLNDHISLIHRNEMNFKCEICPGENFFKTKGCLANHMRSHNGVHIYKCYKCDMAFRRKFERTIHERRHLELNQFECKSCEKRFVTSGELTRHIRTHTGEKPYKCEMCGRGFSQHTAAKHHMRRERSKGIEKRCDYKHGE